jgi:NADP-dependent 3-hydroxy acid dehydrogenase YdfG
MMSDNIEGKTVVVAGASGGSGEVPARPLNDHQPAGKQR